VKKAACILLGLFCAALLPLFAGAASEYQPGDTYDSYVYNARREPVRTPDYYVPVRRLSGHDWGLPDLSDLTDMCYDGRETIFLVDGVKNRLLVLDKNYSLKQVVSSFFWNGEEKSFSKLSCVTADDSFLYLGDMGEQCIWIFDRKTMSPKTVFYRPVIDILEGEDYDFLPEKMVVDYAGRLYILPQNINMGILQMDENGLYMGFIGAPKVKMDIIELLWRKVSTKAQKDRMVKFVPTEYGSIAIDKDGFLYVTAKTTNVDPISRLNTQGVNVLKVSDDDAKPKGDSGYRFESKMLQANFSGIAIRDDGSYLALDSQLGRIYLYDSEGNMLSTFGGKGAQLGRFYTPSDVETVGESILVIDKSGGTLTEFRRTEFGRLVDTAVDMQRRGDYDGAYSVWLEVLKSCSRYPLAEESLARIEIQRGQYAAALERLKKIDEKDYYATAFRETRNNFIRKNFTWLFVGGILLLAALITGRRFIRLIPALNRLRENRLYRELKYSTYVIFHPFDGFWDLKREGRGSVRSASVLYICFLFIYVLRIRYSGYTFVESVYDRPNVLFSCMKIFLPVFLWIVANWCTTTLMDGSGTMKDIFVFTGYALTPYILSGIPMFLLSHVLTAEEAAFYTFFDSVIITWVLALIFFGMMMTHDYSMGKSVLTASVSVVGICIMLFIGLLFISLVQEIITSFLDIYKELSFRAA